MACRSRLFLYCRAGFERETLAETTALAAASACPGTGLAVERSGYALFEPDAPGAAFELAQKTALREWTFARHLLAVTGEEAPPLTPGDRIGELVARLEALAQQTGGPFAELWLGAPDSDGGRALAPLCRSLQGRLEEALSARGLLAPSSGDRRAEIVFLTGTEALVGLSWRQRGALWPMGIPRLRLPAGSPSRAALKLEEAFVQFLAPDERKRLLAPGKTAVDLGAAPGGWSLVLLKAGLSVTAVDRANLAPELASASRLRHVREDGFRFRPSRPVDWLLCDMVEQPARIADLVGEWVASGWCRMALFNLKLPMKKRREALLDGRERIESRMRQANRRCQLRFRQLYHDREEVTGWLQAQDASPRRR